MSLRELLLLPCRDAAKLQSRALDQKLSALQRFGLQLHLLYCRWCRHYGRQLQFLHHAAHDHGEQLAGATPQNLSDATKARIKEKLRQS